MKYYMEILLQPDQEMRENVLMNMVYSKLHQGLVALKSKSIGVSFPDAHKKPGGRLRVHGTKEHLEQLDELNWLGGLRGYCKLEDILAVPSNVQYRTISRKQTNLSKAKLRRLQKRGSIPDEDIQQYRAKMCGQGLENPYFDLVSNSSGQTYRRFLEMGVIQGNATEGAFDTFGLSKEATIPWF